ncbi:MAG: hypothetical protein WDN47_04250 [Candidatus Doudnabacteria bacterium]
MAAQRAYEKIVTDRLTESDWAAILSLNLRPLFLAYLKVFKDNSNQPISYDEVITRLQYLGVVRWSHEKISFNRLSEALKHTNSAYRIRVVKGDEHRHYLYKVVVVNPNQPRERDRSIGAGK